VFLDRDLEAIEDQWALLANAVRMDRERVVALSGEAVDAVACLGIEPWHPKRAEDAPIAAPGAEWKRQQCAVAGGRPDRRRLFRTAGRAA
jgi:hypothetical protein